MDRVLGAFWMHLGALWIVFWNLGSVFEAISCNIEKPWISLEGIAKTEVGRVRNQWKNELGGLVGTLGTVLGRLGSLLGASWGVLEHLGSLMRPLGSLLGALGSLLGGSWGVLGASCEGLGSLLRGSWRHFGGIWDLFGWYFWAWEASLRRLAAIWKNLEIHWRVVQKSRSGASEIYEKWAWRGSWDRFWG